MTANRRQKRPKSEKSDMKLNRAFEKIFGERRIVGDRDPIGAFARGLGG